MRKCFRGWLDGILTSNHKMSFGGRVLLHSTQHGRYAFLIHFRLFARYWSTQDRKKEIKFLLRIMSIDKYTKNS